MGTSRGQCCDTCVTTRAYTPNGTEVWNRNFGTDTIDLYSSGDGVFLIGNDELDFQYLQEIKVTNPSGQKETYVVPLKTLLFNNSNFGEYDIKGRFKNRDNFLEFESSKDQEYIRSYEYVETSGVLTTSHANEISNLYSYPFERYTRAENTKTARIFADNSGVYVVRPNNVFYYMNSGNDYHLKNIGFIGAEYKIPSFESGRIYVGGEEYCHGAIDFIDRFEFQSGSPISGTIEKFNVLFNYEQDYSGIIATTGNIGSLTFNYYDSNIDDRISFSFTKSQAVVNLIGSGCINRQINLSNIDKIYRGTGIFSSFRRHYSGELTSCESDIRHAWNIGNYVVDTGNGRISFELEKIIDTILDSGSEYFRYDSSAFTGFAYPVSGTGIINGYFSHYNTTGLRSSIEQFRIDELLNTGILYKNLEYYSNLGNNYGFSYLNYDSGKVLLNGVEHGDWNLYDFNINSYLQEKLLGINYNSAINNRYSDSLYTNGTTHGYIAKRKAYINTHSSMLDSYSRVGIFGAYKLNYTVDCSTPPYTQHNCNIIVTGSSLVGPFNHTDSYISGAIPPACNGYTLVDSIQIGTSVFNLQFSYFGKTGIYVGPGYSGIYDFCVPWTEVGEKNTYITSWLDIYIPNELVGYTDYYPSLTVNTDYNGPVCTQDYIASSIEISYSTVIQDMIALDFGETNYLYGLKPDSTQCITYGSLNTSKYALPVGVFAYPGTGIYTINRYDNWNNTLPDINYAVYATGGVTHNNEFNIFGICKDNQLIIINKDLDYVY